MPIQRLPRYTLLLHSLLEATPKDSQHHTGLTEALQMLKDVVLFINDQKKEADSFVRILELMQRSKGRKDLKVL
jgi:hypothetical protein